MEIRNEDPAARVGTVDFGGVSKQINLSFLPEARIGDYVLVHAGFAINAIDEEEAGKIFEYLREIDELGFGGTDSSGDEPAFGSREPGDGSVSGDGDR